MRSACATFACALALPLFAQDAAPDTSEIVTGDPVRITAPALGLDKWRGYFVRAELDSVTVRDSAAVGGERTLPLEQVTLFEVNHGTHPPDRGTEAGAMLGVLGGGIVGAAITAPTQGSSCFSGADDAVCSWDQGRGVLYGALIGAAVGAGVGALIKSEHWEELPINAPQIGLWFLPGGEGGVTVALRF